MKPQRGMIVAPGDPLTPAYLWWYRCAVVAVTDADTLVVRFDLGLSSSIVWPVRLYGIDTPEKYGPVPTQAERDHAEQAIVFVSRWLLQHALCAVQAGYKTLEWPFLVQTKRTKTDRDKMTLGRYEGAFRCRKDHVLADDLADAGFQKRKDYPPDPPKGAGVR